jgi:hypothetical protein
VTLALSLDLCVEGRGCPACKEVFLKLWSMIRSGEVLVMESEGRRATLPSSEPHV